MALLVGVLAKLRQHRELSLDLVNALLYALVVLARSRCLVQVDVDLFVVLVWRSRVLVQTLLYLRVRVVSRSVFGSRFNV